MADNLLAKILLSFLEPIQNALKIKLDIFFRAIINKVYSGIKTWNEMIAVNAPKTDWDMETDE